MTSVIKDWFERWVTALNTSPITDPTAILETREVRGTDFREGPMLDDFDSGLLDPGSVFELSFDETGRLQPGLHPPP